MGTNESSVTCSRGVRIMPDTHLSSVKHRTFDAVIAPGGLAGAKTVAHDPDVQSLLQHQFEAGRVVASICAGPLAIKEAGIARGRKMTSYPSVKSEFEALYAYDDHHRVVVDDNLITRYFFVCVMSNLC